MKKTQEVHNKLDGMKLSDKAQRVIETADQSAIVDLFVDCETAEQVEEIVNEYFGED